MKVDACWALSYLAQREEMLIQVSFEQEEYLGQRVGTIHVCTVHVLGVAILVWCHYSSPKYYEKNWN